MLSEAPQTRREVDRRVAEGIRDCSSVEMLRLRVCLLSPTVCLYRFLGVSGVSRDGVRRTQL